MAKVNRGTPSVRNDPFEGYTLIKVQYSINKKAERSWDEIADCEKQSAPERELYGPYETLEEAKDDLAFLIEKGRHKADELILRKKGLYNYVASIWMEMAVS